MVIELFWWRGNRRGKNFGDELSKYTVEYVSGEKVSWASRDDANLFSVGSILGAAYHCSQVNPDKEVHVWGSGLMTPAGFPGQPDNMIVSAVRGPLTRSALAGNKISLPIGDPGLLIDRVFKIPAAKKKYSLGIVPHHKQKDEKIFQQISNKFEDSVIIDVGLHPHEVARIISQCELVISTSLHGLIVSDALKVPNIWCEWGLLHAGGRFKFYDYFLSVRRAAFEPINLKGRSGIPPDIKAAAKNTDWSYLEHLEPIKDELEASFPKGI